VPPPKPAIRHNPEESPIFLKALVKPQQHLRIRTGYQKNQGNKPSLAVDYRPAKSTGRREYAPGERAVSGICGKEGLARSQQKTRQSMRNGGVQRDDNQGGESFTKQIMAVWCWLDDKVSRLG
jgi:hypothetical protein